MNPITIRILLPTETTFIQQIAQWYHQEWQTSILKTIHRLTDTSKQDVLFQLLLMQ